MGFKISRIRYYNENMAESKALRFAAAPPKIAFDKAVRILYTGNATPAVPGKAAGGSREA
jgi:hypothetical protein